MAVERRTAGARVSGTPKRAAPARAMSKTKGATRPKPAPVGHEPLAILGGMTAERFLREHWQKKPLLVRQAVPGFAGIVDVDELTALAGREHVQARLVFDHKKTTRKRHRWELVDGPLLDLDVGHMPERDWTFLVQGLESLVPGGWDLLRRFSFLPAARIDDLMVSWAAPGGSVGPHDDLYDVFLLQGPGRRRWQIATDYARDVDETAPIKVLADFKPAQEFVLEPGDMLYLPPRVAHWGTAVDACFTYSIGFLAPSHDALQQNFLAFLGQRLAMTTPQDALYEDPDLRPSTDPLTLGDDMVAKVTLVLQSVAWSHADIEEFTGRLLTGPKPSHSFEAPRALSPAAFHKKLRAPGRLRLALPTRGLLTPVAQGRPPRVFLNGEMRAIDPGDRAFLRSLIDQREVELPVQVKASTELALYELYATGGVAFAAHGARARARAR